MEGLDELWDTFEFVAKLDESWSVYFKAGQDYV